MAMRQDFLQDKKLRVEHSRVGAILANLMPAHVLDAFRAKQREAAAARAANGERAQVTSYGQKEDSVSVLFCDIMDFSTLAAESSPKQLVRMLDCLYSMFDMLCKKHNVVKMETVGKTFMAAAGLNVRLPFCHVLVRQPHTCFRFARAGLSWSRPRSRSIGAGHDRPR